MLLGYQLLNMHTHASNGAADVNTASIQQPRESEWPSYGRDYHEQRHSPLAMINTDNVDQLGLAWSFDTDFSRGLEATPLVVDGVMYVTGNWSVVYALDASNGELLWRYDPQVAKVWGKMACCDVVNRGVALYEGKVFVGTLDARLVALDANSGEVLWEAQTADTTEYPYTITGAPRAAKGKVYIGNGGGEYGVRGFVSAYDVDTGELVWRFYTVPGNPTDGFEDATQAMAAETWTGSWWLYGGGGTVWDSIVYDPYFDQLIIGVGNGSPWNRRIRSPGGGDNLFLASIVALNPDSGAYRWHYQQVPAETWDYTATQHIMLADMNWQGETRKVIWQAPKNGFFFIIDRSNGKLLSAEPYVEVNWASHYNVETGRPVEIKNADYSQAPYKVRPSNIGAHNWQPMSYHPDTGLVYIPAISSAFTFADIAVEDYEHQWGHYNPGVVQTIGKDVNSLLREKLISKLIKGSLLAWNPAEQREAWQVDLPRPFNGGLLTTAGGLLFQGHGGGYVVAMQADTGQQLWQYDTGVGIIGSPVSYAVDGTQYIAIGVGWGGAGTAMPFAVDKPATKSRILSFKLGGSAMLPPSPPRVSVEQPPSRITDNKAILEQGSILFSRYCAFCHGRNENTAGSGRIPDLRMLPRAYYENFDKIVLDGVMEKAGMAGFSDVLDKDDAHAIKAYILDLANDEWELRQQPQWWIAIQRWFYSIVAEMASWFID